MYKRRIKNKTKTQRNAKKTKNQKLKTKKEETKTHIFQNIRKQKNKDTYFPQSDHKKKKKNENANSLRTM